MKSKNSPVESGQTFTHMGERFTAEKFKGRNGKEFRTYENAQKSNGAGLIWVKPVGADRWLDLVLCSTEVPN